MKNKSYSLFLILTVVYFFGAFLFFFFPGILFSWVNGLGNLLIIGESIPPIQNRFWLVPTFSFMIILSLISGYTYQLKENKFWIGILIRIHWISKIISTTLFLSLFFWENRYFAYLFSAAIDFLIALTLFLFYKSDFNQEPFK